MIHTPGWYGEARFEGTFVKYGVLETSFRIDDRFVDHEYEHHDVIIKLIVGFAHCGTAQENGISVQFWYDSEAVC